ncbi:hypothetical protein ACFY4C_37445 [Actinomadura viridis]|uniref:hypothetical protein n=1 Tax=Actinomadura viridis TaxID=58110 RepID=UPI0036986D86
MPGTTAPPKTSPAPLGQQDFEEVMRTKIKENHRRVYGSLRLLVPLMFLLVGAAAGWGIRALAPAWTAVLPAAVFMGLAVVAIVREYWTGGPLKRVDWSTADAYEQQLAERLSAASHEALLQARDAVLRNRPTAVQAHFYEMRFSAHQQVCTGRGCPCFETRFNAAVLPARARPVIVIGDLLLAEPAAARYVLAHEAHHIRRPWMHIRLALSVPAMAGWLALGLLTPPDLLIVLAPVLWVVILAVQWVDELAADVAAARATGRHEARSFWNLLQAMRRSSSRWQRVIATVLTTMAPMHPPIALRAAIADRFTRR